MESQEKPPQEQETARETPQTGQEKPPRRMRRKAGFRIPAPAVPVKALWKSASPEEQTQAHRTAILVLEHWMGRMNRKELAQKLGIPQVRVWQISQAALSGMVSGLLRQPKSPPPGTRLLPEEDPISLRRKITDLEKQNATLTDLISIIRDMPATREALNLEKQEAPNAKGKKRRHAADQGADIPPPQDQKPPKG